MKQFYVVARLLSTSGYDADEPANRNDDQRKLPESDVEDGWVETREELRTEMVPYPPHASVNCEEGNDDPTEL